ncbi:ankyrin repeat domain-containing protein [Wolbachia endosymbiont of Listronotus oregonensis]|uniref:ankyrin repeat domain-containing protein n=2 Tax=Wolbachia TaxID=953 RepID=UPI002231F892|nr:MULTISPECIES: ankyrin repeat domain-containing protein [unclassified Wolbachia]WMT83988.1 ankyrin repeat domain-containing protein [Wolbachia endosymbiont of Listronotus oregonensis]
MNGGVPSKGLNEQLRDILDKLEQDINLLDNPGYIQHIMFLLGAGADPNTTGTQGEKTLSDYSSEKLRDILNELASNSDLLDNSNYTRYIMFLLQAGADPNTTGTQGEKTLSDYSSEKLRDILNELAIDRSLLDNYAQHIIFLLGAGANRDTQNRYGKTLSHYLDKRLSDILGWLAIDRGILNDYIQRIMFLLQAGANPNVQNQDGKTLLHYVAERNDTDGIGFLLKAGADRNVQDQSGKTPFEYVTEHNCLQALKDLGCSSNDETTCTKLSDPDPDKDQGYYSDDSRKNEGNGSGDDNKTVPTKDKGNLTNNSSNYPNKHNDDQTLRDDPGYSSGDDNKTISTEPSDCDRKDEDSSCSSSDHLFLEDLLSMKLEIPLTTSEEGLIKDFCEKIRGITAQNKQESEESILESIEKIVNEYLKKGIRLNSSCNNGNENDNGDKETVTSLILEEIEGVLNNRVKPRDETRARERQSDGIADQDDGNEDKVSGIIESITNKLLLKGGKARQKFFSGNTELAQNYGSNYINDLSKKYKETKDKLKSIAYESIVGRDRQAQKGEPEEVDIDNVCFYVKYSQDSIIEPVKIFNKAEDLNLKVGILQVGESIVRVEGTKDGKRNYTDVLESSIKMSFTTEAGEINIYLSPSEKDSNKIEVEIDDESEERLNKLKAEKKSLGENCLLGGKSVLEAIEEKGFKKNGNVPTESIETIKDVPRTDVTQACSQQINTRAKGK